MELILCDVELVFFVELEVELELERVGGRIVFGNRRTGVAKCLSVLRGSLAVLLGSGCSAISWIGVNEGPKSIGIAELVDSLLPIRRLFVGESTNFCIADVLFPSGLALILLLVLLLLLLLLWALLLVMLLQPVVLLVVRALPVKLLLCAPPVIL